MPNVSSKPAQVTVTSTPDSGPVAGLGSGLAAAVDVEPHLVAEAVDAHVAEVDVEVARLARGQDDAGGLVVEPGGVAVARLGDR